VGITVLGLAGSPRRNGNTETLLDWCLDAATAHGAEVVKFRLRELDIGGCIACDGCFETGACIVEDGMDQLYPFLRSADSVVLAAPIFSMGLSAQAKAMVDRCQPFWALKHVLKEPLVAPLMLRHHFQERLRRRPPGGELLLARPRRAPGG
jgi:multimeric flavodoxin WrbA